jgi:hypothetical protein
MNIGAGAIGARNSSRATGARIAERQKSRKDYPDKSFYVVNAPHVVVDVLLHPISIYFITIIVSTCICFQ